MDLPFFYKYGYDYGSRHVHPMSDDGSDDFFAITKLDRGSELSDQRSVISNSVLVGCLIVQDALNPSSFCWRAVVYDFLVQLMSHLENGSMEYGLAMQKVMYFAPGDLCKPL